MKLKEYLGKVAEFGCYVGIHFPEATCGGRGEVHHQLGCVRDDYKTMPLCTWHHSAQTPLPFGYAVHKGTKSFESRYGTQKEMVEWTQAQIGLTESEE